jgi:hypothetical protein
MVLDVVVSRLNRMHLEKIVYIVVKLVNTFSLEGLLANLLVEFHLDPLVLIIR